MKKTTGALCLILGLVLVGSIYWAHRVHEQERLYRESLIEKLEDLGRQWADIQSTRFQLELGSFGMPEGDVQRTVISSSSEELDRREAQVRENFALLEKTIRNSNGGILPDWVKEHQSWRELDQALAKFR
jgi:hypothetical protein